MSKRKLSEISIEEFANKLGSGEPTPGGGAAAALESALGAALIMMVANHTIGKKKYIEFDELNRSVIKEATALKDSLLEGTDKDAEAFGKVSAAYKMPQETEEEKNARSYEIAKASVEAANAPLDVMRNSIKALRLAKSILCKSNPNLKSDIYVAAHSLYAGIRSASYNVDANLPYIESIDQELALSIRNSKDEILREAGVLMSEIVKS